MEKNIRIRHIVLSVIAVEPKIDFNANELCDCNQFYIAAGGGAAADVSGCRLGYNFGFGSATHSVVHLFTRFVRSLVCLP